MSHSIRALFWNRSADGRSLGLVVVACCLVACLSHTRANGATGDGYWPQAPLSIQQGVFVDSAGRQVMLNGINLVDTDPSDGFNPAPGPQLFGQLRDWGFNCVRLGIVWAGVEPEPGKYNEAYLAKVDQCIRWAASQKIFVILDVHQRLYGMKFGHGAPDWATLDEEKENRTGTVWTDSYFVSQAVQTAFANFWGNKPAPDNKGIQDHYVALWEMLARRYAKEPYVLGYDLMNDPYMGAEAQQVLPLFLQQYVIVLMQQGGKEEKDLKELEGSFGDEFGRVENIRILDPAEHYSKLVDAVEEVHKKFETDTLQPFYQRIADTIRAVDPSHVLFLEQGYFANIGVRSTIRPTTKDGKPDPQVAYAPHAYDLLTDTRGMADISPERTNLTMSRIAESGQQSGMPTVVGEWGSFKGVDPLVVEPARLYVKLLEEYTMGSIYWDYNADMGTSPYFEDAVLRAYPICVAGQLQKYGLDREANQIEVTWKESDGGKLPTSIYIPNRSLLKLDEVALEPKAKKVTLWHWPSRDDAYVLVYPDPGNVERKLTIPLEDKRLVELLKQAPGEAKPAAPAPPAPAAKAAEKPAEKAAPAAKPAAKKPATAAPATKPAEKSAEKPVAPPPPAAKAAEAPKAAADKPAEKPAAAAPAAK